MKAARPSASHSAFGKGAADLKTVVNGFVMTAQGLSLLGSGGVDAGSGKTPGGAAPLVVAVATGNPLGLVVSGAAKAYGEASGSETIEGAAQRTAKTGRQSARRNDRWFRLVSAARAVQAAGGDGRPWTGLPQSEQRNSGAGLETVKPSQNHGMIPHSGWRNHPKESGANRRAVFTSLYCFENNNYSQQVTTVIRAAAGALT